MPQRVFDVCEGQSGDRGITQRVCMCERTRAIVVAIRSSQPRRSVSCRSMSGTVRLPA
jgi:hypothetical protein